MNTKYQVFISAGSTDFPFADEVFWWLDHAQIPAYFCVRSIPAEGRSNFVRSIISALEDADHMVVVVSDPANIASPWTQAERELFLCKLLGEGLAGNIVIIRCGEFHPRQLPLELRRCQMVDRSELDSLTAFLGRRETNSSGNIRTANSPNPPGANEAEPDQPANAPEQARAAPEDHSGAQPKSNAFFDEFRRFLVPKANILTSWIQANLARLVNSDADTLPERVSELDPRFVAVQLLLIGFGYLYFSALFNSGSVLGMVIGPIFGIIVGVPVALIAPIVPVFLRVKLIALLHQMSVDRVRLYVLIWAVFTVLWFPFLLLLFMRR